MFQFIKPENLLCLWWGSIWFDLPEQRFRSFQSELIFPLFRMIHIFLSSFLSFTESNNLYDDVMINWNVWGSTDGTTTTTHTHLNFQGLPKEKFVVKIVCTWLQIVTKHDWSILITTLSYYTKRMFYYYIRSESNDMKFNWT